MRVCFVALSAYGLFDPSRELRHGGAELQMYLLAKQLATIPDIIVYFVTGDVGQSAETMHEGVHVLKASGATDESHMVRKFWEVWRTLQKTQADVFITTTKSNVGFVVSLFCLFNRKKHLHRTANEPDVDDSYIQWPLFKRILYTSMIKNASAIITQQPRHQQLLEKNFHRKSTVIPNSFVIPPDREISLSDKNGVLWVGRNVRAKQPDVLLQLAEKFPDMHFVVVCNESESPFIKNIEATFRALNNVEFYHTIPFEEIQAFYNRAKVFISTSLHEGFPNTFIQAGLGKTPIISLHVNPNDMFNQYACGIWAKGNYEVFENSLGELMQNDTRYTKYSEGVFAYVQQNHDINKNSTILVQLLKNI
jgi:glycosyltransferase involved in cell wall biosynthesis